MVLALTALPMENQMRISTNPSELPHQVIGTDRKIHYAFVDCDECVCGMNIWSREKKDVADARLRRADCCGGSCMEYDYYEGL